MCANEFGQFSRKEKIRVILNRGILIHSIIQCESRVSLYALDMLFIEVWGDLFNGEGNRIKVAEEHDLDKFLPVTEVVIRNGRD